MENKGVITPDIASGSRFVFAKQGSVRNNPFYHASIVREARSTRKITVFLVKSCLFLVSSAGLINHILSVRPLFLRQIRHIVCLWMLIPTMGFSQSRISGQVQTEEGKSLPFATVLLLSVKDSSLVNGAITTEVGAYVIDKVLNGSYCVAVSLIGYHKVYSAPFVVSEVNQSLQLPLLVTQRENQQLEEISVIAQRPLFEQQLDRLVVNVQSSINTAGATALDILERSPGVSVNRQANTLSMLGKSGVMVMVNGKLSRLPTEAILQMLTGMNAGNIDKIELITTPSAHFDAEGSGGIINLVLKKNQEYGTNGSYSLTMGYGWYERPGATSNLNHRSRKWNLFANGSFLWDHYWFSTYTSRRFLHQGQPVQSSNHSDRDTYHMSYNARLGFEYNLGVNTSLNGIVAGFNNRQEQFALNLADTYKSNELSTSIQIKDHEINQWRHLMANLNLQHSFPDRSKLTLDLDYLLYNHQNPHWYQNHYQYWQEDKTQLELVNSSKRTPIHIGVGKVDYNWKINEKSKLETGFKGTLSRLNNNVVLQKLAGKEWQTLTEFSENLHMSEGISAAYLNVHHQVTAQTKLQAGLRWEYTHTDLFNTAGKNLLQRRYHYLFPSLFIYREINKESNIQFSYSRRITRPTYSDLAPVFTFVDPYTSFYGNTSLRPSITDAVQAVYQWKKSYMLTLQYSYDKNAIGWLMRVDPEQNKQFTYKENIKGVTTYSLNLSLPVSLASWWQIQNNLLGNWQQNKTSYQGENIQVSGYAGQVNSTQTFTLPKSFSLEVSCLYKSPSYFGILQSKSSGSVNMGIQKKFNKQGGTLRFTITDLFWTMRFEVVNNIPVLNLNQNQGFRYEARVLRLTYSRNFGNRHVKALDNRSTGSEEERKRVGN